MCTNLYIFIKFHYLFNSCQRQFLLLKVILKNVFHKNYAFLNHTLNYVNLIHLQNHNQFNCWFYLFIFKIHITKSLIIIKSIPKNKLTCFRDLMLLMVFGQNCWSIMLASPLMVTPPVGEDPPGVQLGSDILQSLQGRN